MNKVQKGSPNTSMSPVESVPSQVRVRPRPCPRYACENIYVLMGTATRKGRSRSIHPMCTYYIWGPTRATSCATHMGRHGRQGLDPTTTALPSLVCTPSIFCGKCRVLFVCRVLFERRSAYNGLSRGPFGCRVFFDRYSAYSGLSRLSEK